MFVGHFALALATKKPAPEVSLGTTFLAAQWADLLWPLLLLTGVERVEVHPGDTVVTPLRFVSYPITHSLAMEVAWGLAVGGVYFLISGRRRGAFWLGVLVVSHWVLDFLTHRPDLPLYPGGPKVGLGLWNSLWGTLMVELGLFALGVVIYVRATRPRDRVGRWAFVGLIAFLLAVYLANLLGPPPPARTGAIAGAGLAMWLLVAWAYWADAHRVARHGEEASRDVTS